MKAPSAQAAFNVSSARTASVTSSAKRMRSAVGKRTIACGLIGGT